MSYVAVNALFGDMMYSHRIAVTTHPEVRFTHPLSQPFSVAQTLPDVCSFLPINAILPRLLRDEVDRVFFVGTGRSASDDEFVSELCIQIISRQFIVNDRFNGGLYR